MDARGWCKTSDVFGEGYGWPIDQAGTLREADGPPRSAVHRDRMIGISAAYDLCRLLGVKMTLTKGWSPASDWH
jgi:hypothetical protein